MRVDVFKGSEHYITFKSLVSRPVINLTVKLYSDGQMLVACNSAHG